MSRTSGGANNFTTRQVDKLRKPEIIDVRPIRLCNILQFCKKIVGLSRFRPVALLSDYRDVESLT
jgi:hypothetical protein